jgi:hypothetical protein
MEPSASKLVFEGVGRVARREELNSLATPAEDLYIDAMYQLALAGNHS